MLADQIISTVINFDNIFEKILNAVFSFFLKDFSELTGIVL